MEEDPIAIAYSVVSLPTPPTTVDGFDILLKPEVTFFGELGVTYVIEASDDLQNFAPLDTIVGMGEQVTYFDTRDLSAKQFYRVTIQ